MSVDGTYVAPFVLGDGWLVRFRWIGGTDASIATNVMQLDVGNADTYLVHANENTPWFEPLPTVWITPDGDASEEYDWYPDNTLEYGCGGFTLHRTGSLAAPLTIHWTYEDDPFGPTAQPGVDFVNEDTSGEKHYGNTYTQITLGQGVSNIEVLIIPLYDEDVEGLEYINVQITTNNGYSIDGSGLQYIYLYDDD